MVITIEIKDMNKKTTALKSSVTRGICLEMHCVSDLERCGQRWNLRLHCVPEAEKEKVCVEVISICQEVLPSERDKIPNAIDVANRVGEPTARWPKAPPFHSQVHPRTHRDGIWKAALENRNGWPPKKVQGMDTFTTLRYSYQKPAHALSLRFTGYILQYNNTSNVHFCCFDKKYSILLKKCFWLSLLILG